MDHCIFQFATRGQCIKGKKLDCFEQKHIFCFKLQCASIVVLFNALPSGGNWKTRWSINNRRGIIKCTIHFKTVCYGQLYIIFIKLECTTCFKLLKSNQFCGVIIDIKISGPLIGLSCLPLLTLVVMSPATIEQRLALNVGPVLLICPRFGAIAQQ